MSRVALLLILSGVFLVSGANAVDTTDSITISGGWVSNLTFRSITVSGDWIATSFNYKVSLLVPSHDEEYGKDIDYCDASDMSVSVGYFAEDGTSIGGVYGPLYDAYNIGGGSSYLMIDSNVGIPSNSNHVIVKGRATLSCTWVGGGERPEPIVLYQESIYQSTDTPCTHEVIETYCAGTLVYQKIQNTNCAIRDVFKEKCDVECKNGTCSDFEGWLSGRWCWEEVRDNKFVYQTRADHYGDIREWIVESCSIDEMCRKGECVPALGFYGDPFCYAESDSGVYKLYINEAGDEEVRVFEACNQSHKCQDGDCVFTPPSLGANTTTMLLAGAVILVGIGYVTMQKRTKKK